MKSFEMTSSRAGIPNLTATILLENDWSWQPLRNLPFEPFVLKIRAT